MNKKDGLSKNQERKYTVKNGRIVNRSTGVPIPDDEPIMILRAKDIKSIFVLEQYHSCCSDPLHKEAIQRKINDFYIFQENNSDQVKEPDSNKS